MSTGVSKNARPTSHATAVMLFTALLTVIAVVASPASSRPLDEATAARTHVAARACDPRHHKNSGASSTRRAMPREP